jgi:hypothetical protein
MHHAFELIIFDLNGTLIDTAPEIADAVKGTLRRFNLPEVTQHQVNGWIGHGTGELQALAFSGHADMVAVRASASLALIAAEFDRNYKGAFLTMKLPTALIRSSVSMCCSMTGGCRTWRIVKPSINGGDDQPGDGATQDALPS